MIHIEDLKVQFGKGTTAVRAVERISFHVGKGESFGLVGESGSGKSTSLLAIAGLIRSWTGRIVVNGEDQHSTRTREFYKNVQMVFQDPYGSLHPRHTIDRTLKEPISIHKLGDANRRIQNALADVGLGSEFRFRFPHQLSGGQRQRVALARAMILNPSILLLDEPTSSLDVSVQAEILNLLKRLIRDHNLTCIMVSHNLAVISHMCDRLLVMNHGQIVEELTVSQLRKGEACHPYSQQLLAGSIGYDRQTADHLVDYSEELINRSGIK